MYYDFADVSSNRYRRYIQCIPRTILLIHRSKPAFVFAQNPSLLLSLLVAFCAPLYRYRYVNDLHTPYVRLNRPARALFWRCQRYCARRSEITIVTNLGLVARFPGARNICVLPDKIPSVSADGAVPLSGAYNILFPCSFAIDEPYAAVKMAGSIVAPDTHIYITGNYRKVGWLPREMPPNVHLTGFVDEGHYRRLLNSADAVLVLTTQEDCLLCGAYEGVAAGKPLVLSATSALMNYFTMGVVYVANDAESIAEGLRAARRSFDSLRSEVSELRIALERSWRRQFEDIRKRLA